MGHGKPHGSFGQGTGLYGEGEIVSLVANFQGFLWYLFFMSNVAGDHANA